MQTQLEFSKETRTEPYDSLSAVLSIKQIDTKNIHEIVSILMDDIEHLFWALC